MPEVIFTGPSGRLEGRYQQGKGANAPVALILHPHPQHGGTMNNKVVYQTYYTFVKRGFSVLRFNFRGVGRSQGEFDNGIGELSDAASALDWMQSLNPNASQCWVAGFSFGAWIGMQLLMRRPEIAGFISVAPPANMYDFTFLAPCPSSGMIINGTSDLVAPGEDTDKLVERLKSQKGIVIDHTQIEGANHFFDNHMDELLSNIVRYLDERNASAISPSSSRGRRGRNRYRRRRRRYRRNLKSFAEKLNGRSLQTGGRPLVLLGTPVVVGRLNGNPRIDRTASKANASASIESPRHPTASTGTTRL